MDTYDSNNKNDYYTALEVAEILGLDKNTILNRCKKGYYSGAIKTGPVSGNPHGMWLVPKREIDSPTMIQDVATLTRQITPQQLEQAIARTITQALATATEPLQQQIAEQRQEISRLRELVAQNHTDAREQALSIHRQTVELIQETRAERKRRQRWWKFWQK